MSPPEAFEFLTDPHGGSVSIIRFHEAELFECFANSYLNPVPSLQSKRKLHFSYLQESAQSEGKGEEVLSVIGEYPELHIHGGEWNARKVEELIGKTQTKLASEGNATGTDAGTGNTTKPSGESKAASNKKLLWLQAWERSFRHAKGPKEIAYLLSLKKDGPPSQTELYRPYDIEGHEFLRPLQITLFGPANTGKSTFFNTLLGEEHALVSEVAGTTRDLLKASLHMAGHEIMLIDTAGLLENSQLRQEEVHASSENICLEAIKEADILLCFGGEMPMELSPKQSLIRLQPKADLNPEVQAGEYAFSCLKGTGLEPVYQAIEKKVRIKKKGTISPRFILDQELFS
ncbi:MAG: 50S ribosome-binding GTPase [Planctomycetes bacterium]|nr:50S ribosome-binding GTPase [Planctomycetota bacterium]